VQDDGVGFDPASQARTGSYGLRGLKSLVEDGGGVVNVESSPETGTTVRLVVERR
jgi:two-component system NarL family sensor kinase